MADESMDILDMKLEDGTGYESQEKTVATWAVVGNRKTKLVRR